MVANNLTPNDSKEEESPFFRFEPEPRKRDALILDAYQHHIAPYLGRQEACTLEAARLYAKYIGTLNLDLAIDKFPWVPVGVLGCLPVIGHLDPIGFAQSAPLPQWFAPRVLLTEEFYLKSMERFHAALLEGQDSDWFAAPHAHLPRLRPSSTDSLDTLAWLSDFGIFQADRVDEWRRVLDDMHRGEPDTETLITTFAKNPMFAGFDAALKYLEETQPCVDVRQLAIDPVLQSAIPTTVAESNDLLVYHDCRTATFVLSPHTERFHLGDLIAQKRDVDREVFFVLVSSQHQRPHLASQEGLRIRQLSMAGVDFEDEMEDPEAEETAEITIRKSDVADLNVAEGVSTEHLVQWLLFRAVTIGASDIHFEQLSTGARVRMRVDGTLIEAHKMGLNSLKGVLAMIKNSCGMNPSHLDTDDNRFTVSVDGKSVDVRVSAVPFRRGYQKIVMRLLDKGAGFKKLSDLKLPDRHASIIGRACRQTQGLILVTGPTGSGKSTTLYAMLDHLNQASSNIHTIEDPIEYELDGLNQTQINLQRGLNYERVLRSLLRQDPDTMMIGEIRDRETAEAAANAALTGHLVMSTVHALSAISTVRRLTQIGVPSYMLGESLILLQAQRLVRRLCECKRATQPTNEQLESFEAQGLEAPEIIYKEGGCSSCLNTGTKGRLSVMELCQVDDRLGEMIANGAGTMELELAATEAGFQSLYREGLEHCLQGTISYETAMTLNKAW